MNDYTPWAGLQIDPNFSPWQTQPMAPMSMPQQQPMPRMDPSMYLPQGGDWQIDLSQPGGGLLAPPVPPPGSPVAAAPRPDTWQVGNLTFEPYAPGYHLIRREDPFADFIT